MISAKFIPVAILLFATYAQSSGQHDRQNKTSSNHNQSSDGTIIGTRHQPPHHNPNLKYSSRIPGSRYGSGRPVFGIRTFPLSKTNFTEDHTKIQLKVLTTTQKVLDFRIEDYAENEVKDDDEKYITEEEDLIRASAGGGNQKKEADEDEEKTLAQQVADGKYGLIQNELFANGSKRPGILSYKPNDEVPKDTKDNLGGLEKDEIWLAEDHILVLRGGNYKNEKENERPTTPAWPPIDNYIAPKRQVKIPKYPEIPPPFPVQLSEDGPVEFIKGQNNPSFLPPLIPPLPPFAQDYNKTFPVPFTVVPISSSPEVRNHTLPVPLPPHLLPPYFNSLPPGATFVAPSDNRTDIDEDDPSIYYPPKYDFYYPFDNTTAVPPGPLVPGIILPPPPDFFSLWKQDKTKDKINETDESINSVNSNTFTGPKYLPVAPKKPTRTRVTGNGHAKRPSSNVTNSGSETIKSDEPGVTYVYPENSKSKLITTATPMQGMFRASNKVHTSKSPNGFNSPIFVPNDPSQPFYHPIPTTSPKPNHITLPPTTKSLPKHILIITTPQTTNKNKEENLYNKIKSVKSDLDKIRPEIHPLRSLIKPNVTVSYNGKYGHLPPPVDYNPVKPETDITIIRGHYVTQPPLTKASKVPSTEVNSITVTPVPVVKKVRLQQNAAEKPEESVPPQNPTKATLYFYEEVPAKQEEPPRKQVVQKAREPAAQSPAVVSSVQPEVKPMTPYYYTAHSTSKTPIRQFLEETFHSSNVLTRKPQIAQVSNAEIITHNGYSDIPKMKHLNYGTPISSPRPAVKYHYVTDGNTVVVPKLNVKDLEIKNSGSSGFQTVHLDSVRPAIQPLKTETYVEQSKKPAELSSTPQKVTPNPVEYNTADGPFIPSNYYATARPDHIHFTSQEQTLVDDITKNYFNIFGQKINSPSTTPLVPVKATSEKTKTKQESGLSFISEDGRNFKIQQVHENFGKKPSKSSSSFYIREKPNNHQATRPPSNFEKYLKELTGEDQRDYIVSGVFPIKIKKGKGFTPDGIPTHLLQQHPIILPNGALMTRPQVQYQPSLSTTLRPLPNVEIKPQYVQQIQTPAMPYIFPSPVQKQNVPTFSSHFQQYLQELTGLTSPTSKTPVKVKNFTSSHPFKPNEAKPKPVSLASDYEVNYKRPRPEIEPSAEIVSVPGQQSYDNIKIVDSPDLSKNPNPAYGSIKQIPYDVGKVFFQNLQKPDFFSRPHQTGDNTFVSYNFPGNGGHFYFLTPQIAGKENGEENQSREKHYKRVNRSHKRPSLHSEGIELGLVPRGSIEKGGDSGYSSPDYLRRRRKKP